MCTRSSEPFYIVNYYIKWVTTSWTYCTSENMQVKITDKYKSCPKSRPENNPGTMYQKKTVENDRKKYSFDWFTFEVSISSICSMLNFYLYKKKNVIRIFKIHLKQGQIVDKTAQEKTSHRFMI